MNFTKDQVKLFETIFEQTPVSTQIFTPDGETLLVNKAWEKLWNVKFSQVGSYNILKDKQLVETGTMPYIQKAFNGHVVTLPPIKYEPAKTVNIKGVIPYRWLSAQMYPIKDAKGKILYLVLQHNDITERIHSEETNARLAAIVQSSSDAIVSKTLDGIIRSWNKSAERVFGYKAKEAIGKHITLIIPKELQKEEDEIIAKLKKGQQIKHFETTRQAKDRKLLTVSLSISPIKNKKGEIIGASKIARDITNQKKSEAALKESEERLRIALDAGKIGVWDWDIQNNIITWNKNVFDIHGVKKQTRSFTFEEYKNQIHPDDKNEVVQAIEESKKSGTYAKEFRIIAGNGQTRWVSAKAVVFFDKNNNPLRMLGATSDITKQKQLEQEKSDFLSMASHELKTPLTSMKMFVDLLYRELQTVKLEKPVYFAKRLKDQTNRLTELTNDLLDVSRIETGKLLLNKEPFNLSDLIQETVEGLQATTDHKIKIRGEKQLVVIADKYRMYQVLVNLLTNAIKYSPNGKEITITTQKDITQVTVRVIDQGIGIDKEKHERIFERLYQVADPEEKTYPGLGLGLYITKEIILKHNGEVGVKSKKGHGSTFYFTIPIK